MRLVGMSFVWLILVDWHLEGRQVIIWFSFSTDLNSLKSVGNESVFIAYFENEWEMCYWNLLFFRCFNDRHDLGDNLHGSKYARLKLTKTPNNHLVNIYTISQRNLTLQSTFSSFQWNHILPEKPSERK